MSTPVVSTESTGYTNIQGNKIYYRIKGEGPPMVFVHGWSLNLSYWDAQVEFFSKNYCTYSYDWTGMGNSGGGQKPYLMKDLGKQLGGVIDAFGISNPIIVGHSEGGGIVMRYAASNPGKFSRLVLADTALNSPRDAVTEVFSTLFIALFSQVAKDFGKNPLVALAPVFEQQFYSKGFIAANPEYISKWKAQFISNSPTALVNGLRAWAWRIDIGKKLAKVTTPTLLLWGTEDTCISLQQMQNIQLDMPNTELIQLQGSGHMTPVEVPDNFNKTITTFLG
jgi:3-oxoadipate enol-lactonase